MTPDEIRQYGIKNRLPKAVIYKMLEKYHYITFFKYLKNILADGEVDVFQLLQLDWNQKKECLRQKHKSL